MPARPLPMTHDELEVAVRLAGSPRRLAAIAWLPVSTVLGYASGKPVPPRHVRALRALTSRDFLRARAEVDPEEVELAERRRVVASLIDRADELEQLAREEITRRPRAQRAHAEAAQPVPALVLFFDLAREERVRERKLRTAAPLAPALALVPARRGRR